MASASSDDDGHSFGSEPDFAAMSSLRLVGDDPGPSGTHVFDEIHDDAPRDFGHELEVADGERLRAALEAFEDAVYDDGAGGASSANDPGSGPVAAAGGVRANPASARAKPRRVHADRQTTRPVLEQAREYERSLGAANRLVRSAMRSSLADATHPLPVKRVAELDKFAKSTQYAAIISGGTPLA